MNDVAKKNLKLMFSDIEARSSFTHFQTSNCAQIRTKSRSPLEINAEKALAPRP